MERLGELTANSELAAAALLRNFAAVYSNNQRFVWRIVRRLGIPTADADDAVQDVFLIVLRRYSGPCDTGSVRRYLRVVAKLVCSNRRRAYNRRRLALRIDRDVDTDTLASCNALVPEEEVGLNESRRALNRAVAALEQTKREIFMLAEVQSLTLQQISVQLGLPQGTVCSRLRAARVKVAGSVRRSHAKPLRAARENPPRPHHEPNSTTV